MLNLKFPFGGKDDRDGHKNDCDDDKDKYCKDDKNDRDHDYDKDKDHGQKKDWDDKDHKYARKDDDCENSCKDDKYARKDDDCRDDDECDMQSVLASMTDVSASLDYAVNYLDSTPTCDTVDPCDTDTWAA